MQDEQSRLRTDDILSQADIILPSQYFGSVGSAGRSGEQRLMLAVLVDAINVLQSWKGNGSVRKRQNFAEAAQWVNTRGTRHPFSFDSVCHVLEIDSELLRSRLRVLTVRPANSVGRPTIARLRLKELSRRQHLSAYRLRRRENVSRGMAAVNGSISESTSGWETHAGQSQQRTAEKSTGLAAFGERSTVRATGESLSC